MSEANGSAPASTDATTDEPCVDCATSGEKTLAIVAGVFGILVLLMAIDIFTGGKISGTVMPVKQ